MSDMNNNYKNMETLPPFKLCVLQNFPFIEADFDAVTNYQLLCKVVEYLNKVIDNSNIQNDNISQLEQNFITLYNYVKDYFNNLDVQNEINNKLDEMAQNGELERIYFKYAGYVTPQMFGAKADGITDDTEALQNCFNSIGNNNNIVMNGTYIVSKPIMLPTGYNNNIYGGCLKASDDFNGDTILYKKNGSVPSPSGWNVASENLTIENVTIDCNYVTNGIITSAGLRISINNCRIYNLKDYGIDTGGVDSHEINIFNTNIIGHEYITKSTKPYTETCLRLTSADCQINHCVFCQAQYGIYFSIGGQLITDVHIYCNSNGGGAFKAISTRLISFSNCYFDSGSIDLTNPFNMTFNDCYFLITEPMFTIHGTSIYCFNMNNCNVKDGRTDISSPINFFNFDGIREASGNKLNTIVTESEININSGTFFNICDIVPFFTGKVYECTYDSSTSSISSIINNSEYTVNLAGSIAYIKYNGSDSNYKSILLEISSDFDCVISIYSNTSLTIYDDDNNLLGTKNVRMKKNKTYKIVSLRPEYIRFNIIE